MRPTSLIAAALLATAVAPRAARGDRIRPVLEGGAVANLPAGALGDQLGDGWALRSTYGLGRGPFAFAVPIEIGGFHPLRPERDSTSLFSLGVGLELAGTLVQGRHAGLRARAGYQWRWLSGDGEVRRTCDQVGSCDGGFWHEEPSYLLQGPSAGLSATWSWRADDARIGLAVDGRLERARVELPGSGVIAGPLVAIGVSVWVGPAVRH